MRLEGESIFSLGIRYKKNRGFEIIHNSLKATWIEVWFLFVFRLSRKPSGPGLLKLKSDTNPSKLFLLTCRPRIWSIISLHQGLNFRSPSCKQLSAHKQSEETPAFQQESQWCRQPGGSSEHSPGGCSLNAALFAVCSGTAEYTGKLLTHVCPFRIP